MEPTPMDDLSRSADLKVRKLLGRSYLRDRRLGEALDVYHALAQEYPRDADVLVVVGNLYLLAGWPSQAEKVYRKAQELSPESLLVYRQLTLAQSEGLQPSDNEPDPLSPESIARLRERLEAAEMRGAADLLEGMMPDEQKAGPNGLPHEPVQQLMPALIDLNIRQARASGRADVAEALQSLQISLSRQTGALRANPPQEG